MKIPFETKPPEITIGVSNTVVGWEELDRWGMFNHPHWSAIRQWACVVPEVESLKLLAGKLLLLNVDLMEKYLETARLLPVPPIFVPHGTDKQEIKAL